MPWLTLLRAGLVALAVGIGGLALYAPFFDSFYAFVRGIGQVTTFTSMREFLVVYGLFLIVLVPLFVGAIARVLGYRFRQRLPILNRFPVLLTVGLLLIMVAVSFALPSLAVRLGLGFLLLLGLGLLLPRTTKNANWYVILLATVGWAVGLGIETIYIRDHLAGGDWYRMNTVFKFGLQMWLLFALAAAAGLPTLLRALGRLAGTPARLSGIAVVGCIALLATSFPLAGTPSRVGNRFPNPPAPTLDGLAFMEQAEFKYDCSSFGSCEPGATEVTVDLRGDAQAIRWLNTNIAGTPIVAQSSLWFYRAYGIRITANTGLPTIISGLHTNEQRDGFLTGVRDSELDQLYRTSDVDTALRLLAKYRANYIYIGGVERAFYNQQGLAKFARMVPDYLDKIYDQTGVTIYKVRGIPQLYAQPKPVGFAPNALPPPEAPSPITKEPQPDLPALGETGLPTDGPTAFGLAERYRNAGRLEDAIRVLEVAAPANPGDIGIHHLWGDILSQMGRYDEAEQAYTLAAESNPTAGNWNKLGAGLLQWGKLDKAELALLKAVESNAQEPEPHYLLGKLYMQTNQLEKAQQELQTYLQLAPSGQFSADATKLLESK